MFSQEQFRAAAADPDWVFNCEIPDDPTPSEMMLLHVLLTLHGHRQSRHATCKAVKQKFVDSGGDPKWLPLMIGDMFLQCIKVMPELPKVCPDAFIARTLHMEHLLHVSMSNGRTLADVLDHVFQHWCPSDKERRIVLKNVLMCYDDMFASLDDDTFRECVRLIKLPPDGVIFRHVGGLEIFKDRNCDLCPFTVISRNGARDPNFLRGCSCGAHLDAEASHRLSLLLYDGVGDESAILEFLNTRVEKPVELLHLSANAACDSNMLIKFYKFITRESLTKFLPNMNGKHSMLPFLQHLPRDDVEALASKCDKMSTACKLKVSISWELQRRRGKGWQFADLQNLYYNYRYLHLHCGPSFRAFVIDKIGAMIRSEDVSYLDNTPPELVQAALDASSLDVETLNLLPFFKRIHNAKHLSELLRRGLLKNSKAHRVVEAREAIQREHRDVHGVVDGFVGEDITWLVRDFLGGIKRKRKKLTKKRAKELERKTKCKRKAKQNVAGHSKRLCQ